MGRNKKKKNKMLETSYLSDQKDKAEFGFADCLNKAIAKNKVIQWTKYGQLATVNSCGFASVRTVEIRRVLEKKALVICADKRTELVKCEIEQQQSELCWFFPLSMEEFKIRVESCIIGEECTDEKLSTLRLHMWQGLDDPQRQVFDCPAPGLVKKSDMKEGDLDRYDPQSLSSSSPSPNFTVVLLYPIRCDYLVTPTTPVDNSKPVHRESILQPTRSRRRFLHTLNCPDDNDPQQENGDNVTDNNDDGQLEQAQAIWVTQEVFP